MTVAITRKELGAAELRREAGRCRDARAARRMLALALVLEGGSRAEAARAAGMDRQTLRDWDWVHRYNAEGLAGLSDRRRPGPRPRLSPEQEAEQEAELVTAVEQGPDPDRDGVVRWRRVDLRAVIEARFAVRLHERCSVGKVLRRLGFARLSVRPRHPKADEAAQEAFKKASPSWYARRFPSAPAASRSRSGSKMVGRGAFNRVGQQGTLTRVWARRGTRPRAPRDRRYAWAYLFGAVCPERAVGAGLVLPYANTEATGLHLAEIGHHVTPGAHAVVVLDGAGWHTAGDLVVPENLTLLPLPRYSPELNPVENVWEYLRQNKLGLRVWPDYGAIVATCCEAWNWLVAAPGRLASITHREWAKAVSN
jgi:transposase